MQKSKLLFTPKQKPEAPLRLICFPYAGGNLSTYIKWAEHLHQDVELTLVQLPGRGLHFTDPAYENMNHLIDDMLAALNLLSEKENIFFGHSMGAKIAYELTFRLYSYRQTLPIHLIVSGSSAPFADLREDQVHTLSDDAFIEKLRDFDGTPESLLENDDLISLVLPTLRKDFKIAETYQNTSKVQLPTSVSIFSGKEDNMIQGNIASWCELFNSSTGVHWFDGGHFFIEHKNKQVVEQVNRVIGLVSTRFDTLP